MKRTTAFDGYACIGPDGMIIFTPHPRQLSVNGHDIECRYAASIVCHGDETQTAIKYPKSAVGPRPTKCPRKPRGKGKSGTA